MQTVLIVVHLMIVVALVGVVLLQRSEGGGLGIGGGSGFMTARGAANALTRATGILAAAFFATSLALSILARYGAKPTDILDQIPATQTQQGDNGLLDQIQYLIDVVVTQAEVFTGRDIAALITQLMGRGIDQIAPPNRLGSVTIVHDAVDQIAPVFQQTVLRATGFGVSRRPGLPGVAGRVGFVIAQALPGGRFAIGRNSG